MSTIQATHNRRASEEAHAERQVTDARDLIQLLSLDLTHCSCLDRQEEYALACLTRSAWQQLVTSLKAQHNLMIALLGERHLPSSYDTLSEPEVLRLLHQLRVRVDRVGTHEACQPMASVRNWLAQMRVDLARFRDYRDAMVHHNLRFVVMLARRYQHRGLGLLDLVQEGALGLMRAVEKFDPERGIRFASYAVWWIREAFARALVSRDDSICFSDTQAREEEDTSVIDLIAAPEESSPEMIVLTADTARGLHQALTCLPVQDADILRLRFGLGKGRTLTLEKIGQQLGLSREQVRLREQRALTRLRTYLQQPISATQQSTQVPRQPRRKAA